MNPTHMTLIPTVTDQATCLPVLPAGDVLALVDSARHAIPQLGDVLDAGLEWSSYATIRDPLGYEDGKLLAARDAYQYVACLDRFGILTSMVAFDHVTKQGVVLDLAGRHVATFCTNGPRTNAYFAGQGMGMLGDASQEFSSGQMTVHKAWGQPESFSAVRIGRAVAFQSGDLRLGQVEFRRRIGPVDTLISAWFALSATDEDPKVV